MRRVHFLGIFLLIMLPIFGQQEDFAHIDFTRAEANARLYQGEDLNNLPLLSQKLTAYLHTDVARFRALYYWVTHNIAGDHILQITNDRKQHKLRDQPQQLARWQKDYSHKVLLTLAKDKKTVCTGYAYLLQKMANYAGLECVIVNGYGLANSKSFGPGDPPNHSWNAIKLDGKWYLCDPTWAAGYTDLSSYIFEFDYDDRYFLMTPARFAKSHKPLDHQWYLRAQDTIPHTVVH